MAVEVLSLVLIALLAFVFVTVWNRRRQNVNRPPGPSIFHLAATLPFFKGEPAEYLSELGKKFGNVFSMQIGVVNAVVFGDWKVIKEALTDKDHELCARPPTLLWREPLKHKGITLIHGNTWKMEKRLTMRYIKHYLTLEDKILSEVQNLVTHLQDISGKVCITEIFVEPIFNIILNFLFGERQLSESARKQLETSIEEAFYFGGPDAAVNYLPFLRYLPGYTTYANFAKSVETMEEIVTKEVEEHVATFQKNKPHRDYMDMYLDEILTEENKDYDLKNLISTSIALFGAGVETTETTLHFSLLYMALWPEIQKKVQIEIGDVIGKSQYPKYEDRKRLPYTQATILEIHRYSSIVPLIIPHSPIRDTTIGRHTIPKDSFVIMNFWAVHHDKKLWGDPEVFRPERFLDSEMQLKRPEFLKPFSAGLRVCAGESLANQEIFLFFTSLLQRFSFRSVTGEKPLSLRVTFGSTRKPEPFHLIMKKRF